MVRNGWMMGCLMALSAVFASGCTGSTVGGFTLFPANQRMLDTAKEFRQYAPFHAPAPRELQTTVLAQYIVEPGDGLLIEPTAFDSTPRFPTDQVVLADGTIDLGKHGRPIVAGRTVEDIEGIVQGLVATQEQKYRVDQRPAGDAAEQGLLRLGRGQRPRLVPADRTRDGPRCHRRRGRADEPGRPL